MVKAACAVSALVKDGIEARQGRQSLGVPRQGAIWLFKVGMSALIQLLQVDLAAKPKMAVMMELSFPESHFDLKTPPPVDRGF